MRISDWSSDVCSSDLSDDLAALSYRIIGVSGGIYAAQSIAFEVPERGSRIIEGWNKVQNRLSGMADEEIQQRAARAIAGLPAFLERMSARSEEHTSELQSLMRNSYAVLCLKKKKNKHHELRGHTIEYNYNTRVYIQI